MPTIFQDVVTSGAVVFNDPNQKPNGAVVWGMDAMDGWDETSSLAFASTPLGAWSDGEIFGSYASARGRYLTLGGYCMADSRGSAEELRELLIGDAFPPNTDIELVRFEPTPKAITVRVTDKIAFQAVGPQQFRWVVPVASESPFKFAQFADAYGPVGIAAAPSGGFQMPISFPFSFVSTSTTDQNYLGMANPGTAPAFPRFSIVGPLVGGTWRLSNDTTGQYLGYHLTVGATNTLTIDMEGQYALLDGELVSASMFGDFWGLDKRSSNIVKLYGSYDPGVTLSATVRPAWR